MNKRHVSQLNLQELDKKQKFDFVSTLSDEILQTLVPLFEKKGLYPPTIKKINYDQKLQFALVLHSHPRQYNENGEKSENQALWDCYCERHDFTKSDFGRMFNDQDGNSCKIAGYNFAAKMHKIVYVVINTGKSMCMTPDLAHKFLKTE